MRVLVCGGRTYCNKAFFDKAMDEVQIGGRISLIIQGGAKGADYLAHLYACKRGIKEEVYNADWYRYKKAAGPIRNKRMLEEGKPDLVVAFPGGDGTAHMVAIARKAGIKVKQFHAEPNTTNFVGATIHE